MFLYLIRLHVPLVVARSPFIRSPVHKIILFVPTFLGSALLLALNMARLTVQQILAYKLHKGDYARLNNLRRANIAVCRSSGSSWAQPMRRA